MRRSLFFAAIVFAASLAGCYAEAAPVFAATHQVTAETDYYKTGPQQGTPSDGKLPAGTKVLKVEDAGSYTVVETEDGMKVHVATDRLKLLNE